MIARNNELNEIIEKLKKVPCVNEIALFGSRAKGHPKKDSDYDIMLFCDPKCRIPDQYYEQIKKLPKKFDVKLVDDKKYYGDIMWVWDRAGWEEQGTPISSDILKDMIPLWKKQGRIM